MNTHVFPVSKWSNWFATLYLLACAPLALLAPAARAQNAALDSANDRLKETAKGFWDLFQTGVTVAGVFLILYSLIKFVTESRKPEQQRSYWMPTALLLGGLLCSFNIPIINLILEIAAGSSSVDTPFDLG